ncbi:hypothetical protein Q3G72_005508 [Acer saccharum]|nr:hypothetical protein Q3G72_005508 [Acer saccharum]
MVANLNIYMDKKTKKSNVDLTFHNSRMNNNEMARVVVKPIIFKLKSDNVAELVVDKGARVIRNRCGTREEKMKGERNGTIAKDQAASCSPIDANLSAAATTPASIAASTELLSVAAESTELPSWLPPGWQIETKVSTSGATSRMVDKVKLFF